MESSEISQPPPPTDDAPEVLESALEEQLTVSSMEISPGAGARRFTLIVTGTVPGNDLAEERELVLKNVERALMGLSATHGIGLIGAAYRSDPIPSEVTDTVPDAPDTTESSEVPGNSLPGPEEPGASDGSPSGPQDSDSSLPNTSS